MIVWQATPGPAQPCWPPAEVIGEGGEPWAAGSCQGVCLEPPAADGIEERGQVAGIASLLERCIEVRVVAAERVRVGVRGQDGPDGGRGCTWGVAAGRVRRVQRCHSPPLGRSRYAQQSPGCRQAEVSSTGGQGATSCRKYSAEVPQPRRTRAYSGALLWTVTCGDVLPWTACLLMACKRSGVRIPIAPDCPCATSACNRLRWLC